MNLSKNRRIVFILAIGGLLTLVMIFLASRPIRAAGPWYVAPGGDDGNDCLSPGAPCATINGAIGKASPGDTIYVASGTYTGTGDQVVLLDRDATLSGGWDATFTTQSSVSTIDGEHARRGMTLNGGVTATLERFTVQNGFVIGSAAKGAGILNSGTLNLNNGTVRGNSVSWKGGGICNEGTLTLNDSTVSGNVADYGGGIYNSGTLTVTNSTVSGNSSGIFSGGIQNGGTLILNSSTISGNTASDDGGGIGNWGLGTLNNSAVSSNTAGDGGGGIYSQSTLTLNNSTVSDNTVSGTSEGSGAGICIWGGTVALNNSTVSGNSTTYGGSSGGGIFIHTGTMTLNSSTVSGNAAEYGGGVRNYLGTLTLQNTALARNTASGIGSDCWGTVGSSGYNLVGDTTDCTFTATTGDLIDVNARLFPMVDLPGYHPLLPDSPAIDAGNPDGCTDHLGDPLTTDQRGTPRHLDGDGDGDAFCDMGAYEFDPEHPIVQVYLPVILRDH